MIALRQLHGRGTLIRSAHRLCALVVLLALCGVRTTCAQTPSPLQEWQYPGGIILANLFEPQIPERRIILGVASVLQPMYPGAQSYRLEGGPVFNLRYRDIAFASSGEGLGVNLLRGKHYRVGISVGYDMGRAESDDLSHLRGLGDVSPAAAMKIFGAWALSKRFPLVLRVDVRRILHTNGGRIGDIGVYLPLPGSSRRFVMFAGPSYTFADQQYMQSRFGVTAAQARFSGYTPYVAHGGAYAKGVGFSATFFITPHWLLNTDSAVQRLLGSAAASPITQRQTQYVVAFSTAYQW